ncbi:hypothetical protein [Limnochorda pilosa]|uniref:Uncharacterized protein n=1 Tax=Limnochorda pilosa TaxID=1555112 RepID=A0A0K2SJI9_LIMPI|nr:hypothetical protein [Limnochorda pilosa]BAS27024.1 hypothetical protein LIP_1167 [Limnochorda pilosa]
MARSNRQKQPYYAKLVGEKSAEQVQRSPEGEGEETGDPFQSVYAEMGMKAFGAFTNLLDYLSVLRPAEALGWGRGGEQARRVMEEAVRPAAQEIMELRARLDRVEAQMVQVVAGMNRMDRFALDTFRQIEELTRRLSQIQERVEAAARQMEALGPSVDRWAVVRGRIPKEEAVELAINAARELRLKGRKLTLAAVARQAGLKYGQVMYAFGNKERFFQQLEGALAAGEVEALSESASA